MALSALRGSESRLPELCLYWYPTNSKQTFFHNNLSHTRACVWCCLLTSGAARIHKQEQPAAVHVPPRRGAREPMHVHARSRACIPSMEGYVWDKASASRRHEERDAGPNGLGDADEPDSAGGSSSLVGRWRR